MLSMVRDHANVLTLRTNNSVNLDIRVILPMSDGPAIFGAAFILKRHHLAIFARADDFGLDLGALDKGCTYKGGIIVLQQKDLANFQAITLLGRLQRHTDDSALLGPILESAYLKDSVHCFLHR